MKWTPEELAEMAAADAEIEAEFADLTDEEIRASDELDKDARALPGQRKRNLDRERAYYRANRERILAQGRVYYQAHRDKIRATQRKRYQERKRRKQHAEGNCGRTSPVAGPDTVTK